MSLKPEILDVVNKLNRVGTELNLLFTQRDLAIDLMKVAVVAREHVLLLGPPGSGKSELIARFAARLKARYFQYLLTRFTEPAEMFGPLDLERFKHGEYRIHTTGMLPEAEVVFLDEIFQASSAILNTLLSLVHERQFHNGGRTQDVPLLTLFAASNNLPDDTTLNAFSDRFALRLEIEPVPDASLPELLDRGWAIELEHMNADDDEHEVWLDPQQLKALHQELARVGTTQVQPLYTDVMRAMRAEGIALSERRMVKGLKLMRAAALVDGRDEADARDLWPLSHVWTNPDEAPVLRRIVEPHVQGAGGKMRSTVRSVNALIDELEVLEGTAPPPGSEGAMTAHLGALGQIRRELMSFHRDRPDLLERVKAIIGERLGAMGRN